jgi:hypothetical protein
MKPSLDGIVRCEGCDETWPCAIAAFVLGAVVGATSLFLVLTVQYQKLAVARASILAIMEKMPPLINLVP